MSIALQSTNMDIIECYKLLSYILSYYARLTNKWHFEVDFLYYCTCILYINSANSFIVNNYGYKFIVHPFIQNIVLLSTISKMRLYKSRNQKTSSVLWCYFLYSVVYILLYTYSPRPHQFIYRPENWNTCSPCWVMKTFFRFFSPILHFLNAKNRRYKLTTTP